MYNGSLFDFRLIDFLNSFRFNKVPGNNSNIDSGVFIEKIFNEDLIHKSIKDQMKIKGPMSIKDSYFEK